LSVPGEGYSRIYVIMYLTVSQPDLFFSINGRFMNDLALYFSLID